MKIMALMVPVMGALSRLNNGMVTNGRRGGTILFSKTDPNLRIRLPLPSELIKLPPNFSPSILFLDYVFSFIPYSASAQLSPRSVSQSLGSDDQGSETKSPHQRISRVRWLHRKPTLNARCFSPDREPGKGFISILPIGK